MNRRQVLAALAALVPLGAVPARSRAAAYPDRPIRLINPYPPGGATEIIGRLVSERMAKSLGQSVIMESKAGASGMIGAELLARSDPDGHTILLGATPIFATNVSLFKNVRYDPSRDFAPVSQVATVPLVLVVSAENPARTLAEFVDRAKRQAGPVAYASPSIGSPPHLMMETLSRTFAIPMTHVPYKGSAQAMTDLVGGQVSVAFDNLISTHAHIQSGRLRALAIGHESRLAALSDVPTFTELGYPNLQAATWLAFVAPANTPPAVIDTLNRSIVEALSGGEIRDRLLEQGAIVKSSSPAQLGEFMQTERVRWQRIVQESGAAAN